MKKASASIFFIFLIFCFSSSFAQYYEWTDQDGVKHYTDNLLEVPRDQRPGISVHKDSAKEDVPDNQTAPPTAVEEIDENPDEKTALDNEKDLLDQEYQSLVTRRKELIDQQIEMEPEAYNVLVKNLNDEIAAFEKKQKAFDAKVEAYNQKITEKNKAN